MPADDRRRRIAASAGPARRRAIPAVTRQALIISLDVGVCPNTKTSSPSVTTGINVGKLVAATEPNRSAERLKAYTATVVTRKPWKKACKKQIQ